MDADIFSNLVGVIVDNLEGGYYHPNMLNDGRIKDPRYAGSGETMFGIDRNTGGSINTSPAGRQFWALIDNANAKDNWSWNYLGGELNGQLKDLAGQMMLPSYLALASRYLSPQAMSIVENDKRLLLHFAYGVWNGEGWFKQFANKFNSAVSNGVTDPDQLTNVAVSSRTQSTNSLIAQGGKKIASLVDSLKDSSIGQELASVGAGILDKFKSLFDTGNEVVAVKQPQPAKEAKGFPQWGYYALGIGGLSIGTYVIWNLCFKKGKK